MLRTIPLSRRGVYRVWGAALLLLGLYLVPVLVSFCLPDPRGGVPWHQARRDPGVLTRHPLVDVAGHHVVEPKKNSMFGLTQSATLAPPGQVSFGRR
jgi:hypothetical protein